MSDMPLRTLVLAGTAESRAVIHALSDEPSVQLTASLAGATPNPAGLPVPTRVGGFGGPEGLAEYCRDNGVGLVIDATHPFARQITRNARDAAASLNIPCLRLERPPWHPEEGDEWRSFDSWQEMADTIPPSERVFLAGGTQSIGIFTKRQDITLWARALNVEGIEGPANTTFINAMPQLDKADERATFETHGITLLCCKNSGGNASFAKIVAARDLGIPVWMLRRHVPEAGSDGDNRTENYHIHDTVDGAVAATLRLAANAVSGWPG